MVSTILTNTITRHAQKPNLVFFCKIINAVRGMHPKFHPYWTRPRDDYHGTALSEGSIVIHGPHTPLFLIANHILLEKVDKNPDWGSYFEIANSFIVIFLSPKKIKELHLHFSTMYYCESCEKNTSRLIDTKIICTSCGYEITAEKGLGRALVAYSKFFDEIDLILEDPELSCNEFAQLYWSFSDELMKYRCTSAGFSGFSELLVFRLVLNLLGGVKAFESKQLTPDLCEYVNGEKTVQQNSSFEITSSNSKQFRVLPDIAILHDGLLQSMISIKTYILGPSVLEEELEKIDLIHKEYPRLKVLLLVFSSGTSENCDKILSDFSEGKNWFKTQFLRDRNETPVSDIINFVL